MKQGTGVPGPGEGGRSLTLILVTALTAPRVVHITLTRPQRYLSVLEVFLKVLCVAKEISKWGYSLLGLKSILKNTPYPILILIQYHFFLPFIADDYLAFAKLYNFTYVLELTCFSLHFFEQLEYCQSYQLGCSEVGGDGQGPDKAEDVVQHFGMNHQSST